LQQSANKMESSQNKLEYHKILIDNKRATKGQEFH